MLMLVDQEDNSLNNQPTENTPTDNSVPVRVDTSSTTNEPTPAPSEQPQAASPLLGNQGSSSEPISNFSVPTESMTATGSGGLPPTPVVAKPSNSKMGMIIKVLVLIIILAGVGVGAYAYGKHHEKVVIKAPPTQPVNLPAQATVSSACIPGRGKQYVIPSDLPNGPFYDVQNNKVIAIEYKLDIEQLFTNSDSFSNAILQATKNYPVNHFSIEPASTSATSATSASPTSSSTSAASSSASSATSAASAAQSAAAAENVHLIMFMVSKAYANSITCGTTSAISQSTQQ